MDDKPNIHDLRGFMQSLYDDIDNLQDSNLSLEGLRDLFMFNKDIAPKAHATGNLLELIHADYETRIAHIKKQIEDVLSRMP